MRRGARLATVNRMLSSVVGFYEFQARRGNRLAAELVVQTRYGVAAISRFWPGSRRSAARSRWAPAGGKRLPRTLSLEQVAAIIDAQRRLRDRFLFALLASTGMRVGQALGLRHEDIVSWERRIVIEPREGASSRARSKNGGRVSIPVAGELIRLWSDYMHEEYGDLDADHVFVNLWEGRIGRPLSLRDGGQADRAYSPASGVSLHGASVPSHVRDAGFPGRRAVGGDRHTAHASLSGVDDRLHALTAEDLRGVLVSAGCWGGEGFDRVSDADAGWWHGRRAPRGWEELWARDRWRAEELPAWRSCRSFGAGLAV